MDDVKLLRKLVEGGDVQPAPDRINCFDPHYEVIVEIGNGEEARILLSKDAYFELMESEY